MNAQTEAIRAEAKRLLETGEVSVVFGYGAGSTPTRTTPVFVTHTDDVDQLIWSAGCSNNLALYVRPAVKLGRVAIVAKSCDAAALVGLIQEKQVKREDLHIIGVPCRGVVDASKLPACGLDEGKIESVDTTREQVSINGANGTQTLNADQVLKSACLGCDREAPALYDTLVGEPVQPRAQLGKALPESIEERRLFWAEAFDKCIRCMACRQVCPLCYCATCFCDTASPSWVSKKIEPEENWMYHTTRAMHMAGRCVGCGECQRACPMGIPVGLMLRELGNEVWELFDYRSGVSLEESPALGTFRDSDEGPKE